MSADVSITITLLLAVVGVMFVPVPEMSSVDKSSIEQMMKN